MIERATSSVGLSLIIVAVAAIVLYEPAHSKTVAAAAKSVAPQSPAPSPSPAIAWEEVPSVVLADKPLAPAVPIAPRTPTESSTRVKDGETFADVAARVYGPGIDLLPFWNVNRDQLATLETSVRPGMLLRTPPL